MQLCRIPPVLQEMSRDSDPVQSTSFIQIYPEPDPNLHAEDNGIDCSGHMVHMCVVVGK